MLLEGDGRVVPGRLLSMLQENQAAVRAAERHPLPGLGGLQVDGDDTGGDVDPPEQFDHGWGFLPLRGTGPGRDCRPGWCAAAGALLPAAAGCYARAAIFTKGDSVFVPVWGVIADWIHGWPSTRSMTRMAVLSLPNLKWVDVSDCMTCRSPIK